MIEEANHQFCKISGKPCKECLTNKEFDEEFGSVFDKDGKITQIEMTDFLQNYLEENDGDLDVLI